jgi:hypothetical protein
MAESKEDYYSIREIVLQVKSFSLYLLRKWWTLLLAVLLGLGLGVIYYFMQKPKYEAETTFILEEKSSSGGGLAGLASQFGFNVGSLGGGAMFSGDNILTILSSKKVVQKVLLSKVDDNVYGKTTLADIYLEFSGIKKSWQNKAAPANFSFSGINGQMSPVQDSILNNIYGDLLKHCLKAERTSKQGSIISVKVTSADCVFSRLLSERLVEEASRLYLDVKVSTAQANINQLQSRSDSLLVLLNRKSYTAAASLPLDYNPGVRSAIVPGEIASRDKAVLATLYAEVTKSLEMSKLMLAQQTPVIQILDRPTQLLSDNKKGKRFYGLIGGLSLLLMAIAGLFLAFWIGKGNNSKNV